MISFKLNKTDYQLIWAFTLFSVFWLSLKFWTERHPIGQIVFDIPIIIAKTLAGFFIVRWLIQKYIIEKRQYWLFFVLTTLALIATGFLDLLRDYFGRGYGWKDLPSTGYIFVHSFYYSAADLGVPFVIIIAKKYYENQLSLSHVKKQQKETELRLLQSQFSPHFLFNNLNALDGLIDSNPKRAKEYLAHLSALYRFLIRSKENEFSSLSDELEMAENYFRLIEYRFGKVYSFQFEDQSAHKGEGSYLPTGTLQVLIENVVKHNGIINDSGIRTSITLQDHSLIIKNNKGTALKDPKESLGTGLENLKQRYALLSDKEVLIRESADAFVVEVPLIRLDKI
ncbi:histidine kinase [Aureisphaera galaxeae]|uniref:sensor histidine kinase n=1 Tax=Aureisphaera galaxeae TaxID=1538023 RepID=UPI002350B9F1|nr:histidine kinase [Aureisphaera galaxeae]MDC8005965.1 histidine kinase [Aureisphaera galaxeae]